MANPALVDTNVISYLTKISQHSVAYQELLGGRTLAVSFQTQAELLAAGFGAARRQRLDDLLAATLKLPQSEATIVWYGRVAAKRKELQKVRHPASSASEGDVWILSSALEFELVLVSHDAGLVHLGRAMGADVLTAIDGLRDSNPDEEATELNGEG